jgi:hypothetical protein
LVQLDPDRLVFFIVRDHSAPFMEVRGVPANAPHQLSAPIETYHFDNFRTGSVFLDRERKTWFMYYLATNYDYFERPIHLKLAPAGERDITPPGAPAALVARAMGEAGVELSWEDAQDADTGVIAYNIYRDGEKVDRVLDLEYRDSYPCVAPDTKYQVSAINFHKVEGPLSDPVSPAGHDCLNFVPVVEL